MLEFLLSNYMVFSLSTVLVAMALATLLQLQFGLAGIVNFGVVGFWGLGMYALGFIHLTLGLPYFAAAIIAVLIVAAVSLFIGWIILDLDSQSVLVATLAFGAIVAHLVTTEKWLTKGVVGLGTVPYPTGSGGGDPAVVLGLFLLLVCVVLVAYAYQINRAPFGRLIAAIRDNELLAQGLGKDVLRHKLVFFVATSTAMGFVGVLSAPVHQFLLPDLLGPGVTFSIWIALVIGGRRSPLGGIVGVLVTIFLFDVLVEIAVPIPQEFQSSVPAVKLLIYGVILIAILFIRPLGLLSGPKPSETTGQG
ncbi:MAG: branched-chain amino acid ABC transporter permease [Pseudomonadota bacterium]